MPKISVVIPVYNAEMYLKKCLDSVVNQTLQDIEIICVNDGSTDNSLSILEEFRAKDTRIKIITQKNSGVGIARNTAIRRSNGEYIAFVDPDDFYPNYGVLDLLYDKALNNNATVVGGSMINTKDGKFKESSFKKSRFEQEGWINSDDYQFDYYFQRFIFKRDFLIKNNLFFPDLRRYQDPIFMTNVLFAAKRLYVIPNRTYVYFESGNTISTNLIKVHSILKGFLRELHLAKKYEYYDLYFEIVERINGDYFINIFKNTKPRISIYKSILLFLIVNSFDYKLINKYKKNYKLKKYLNKYTLFGLLSAIRGGQ